MNDLRNSPAGTTVASVMIKRAGILLEPYGFPS